MSCQNHENRSQSRKGGDKRLFDEALRRYNESSRSFEADDEDQVRCQRKKSSRKPPLERISAIVYAKEKKGCSLTGRNCRPDYQSIRNYLLSHSAEPLQDPWIGENGNYKILSQLADVLDGLQIAVQNKIEDENVNETNLTVNRVGESHGDIYDTSTKQQPTCDSSSQPHNSRRWSEVEALIDGQPLSDPICNASTIKNMSPEQYDQLALIRSDQQGQVKSILNVSAEMKACNASSESSPYLLDMPKAYDNSRWSSDSGSDSRLYLDGDIFTALKVTKANLIRGVKRQTTKWPRRLSPLFAKTKSLPRSSKPTIRLKAMMVPIGKRSSTKVNGLSLPEGTAAKAAKILGCTE